MSFRLKTILGIAIIELTVMAILIGLNQFALGGSAATQLYERAEATTRVFANTVADAVISTDLATLDATIETAISSEDLTYLRIKSPNGFVLSEGGTNEALARPFSRDASFDAARADHVIDLDYAIELGGVSYGTIELGLSTLAVEQKIAQALRWNLIVAAIGMSLVAVFGYGLGTILTSQLHWLKMGANRFADGNLDQKIRVRGHDELAETARCFNVMADALAQDRAQLQRQTQELLAQKSRVDVIVDCMTNISRGGDEVEIPDRDRSDEIGNMARATVIFQNSMRAIEAARVEQQRLISAFDQVAEQVAIFDADGHVLFMNAAFREFNRTILDNLDENFTQEAFLKEGLSQGSFLDVDIADETWIATQLKAQAGVPFEVSRAPDRVLLAAQSVVEGIGTVYSAKDVTALRRSEKQLIQASKMATLGEMATGMAHELNQPLGVIRMAASNCVKRIDKGSCDPTYLSSKLSRIAEQTERASHIINHMRIFGRKAEGKLEPFDLCASVREIASLCRPQLQTNDISFKIQVPEDPAIVTGEKVIFEQVLMNLVSNARDAIEDQPPGAHEVQIEVETGAEGQHFVSVKDTGGGIPEHILDKLFEPFFTTKEPGKGTGLGLSISFGTITAMSGSITAANDERGARFTVALPTAA